MTEPISTIEVLGAGCPNCKALFERTKTAAAELGLQTDVGYSTDIEKIAAMNVLRTPIIAINGVPVLSGSVPDLPTIKELLTNYLSRA